MPDTKDFVTVEKLTRFKQHCDEEYGGGGGTTKYTHNIVMQWRGGSTYNYREGSISFSFQDSNPNSYATNGYTEDEGDIMTFFKNHCGMSNATASAYKKFPINGSVGIGWPIAELWFLTSICNPGFDLWYVGGGAIQVNSNKTISNMFSAVDEVNYLNSMLNGQLVRIYDIVM